MCLESFSIARSSSSVTAPVDMSVGTSAQGVKLAVKRRSCRTSYRIYHLESALSSVVEARWSEGNHTFCRLSPTLTAFKSASSTGMSFGDATRGGWGSDEAAAAEGNGRAATGLRATTDMDVLCGVCLCY